MNMKEKALRAQRLVDKAYEALQAGETGTSGYFARCEAHSYFENLAHRARIDYYNSLGSDLIRRMEAED